MKVHRNENGVLYINLKDIPIGSWELETGKWHFNPILKMTESNQLEYGIANGTICQCGYSPKHCRCNI